MGGGREEEEEGILLLREKCGFCVKKSSAVHNVINRRIVCVCKMY